MKKIVISPRDIFFGTSGETKKRQSKHEARMLLFIRRAQKTVFQYLILRMKCHEITHSAAGVK